MMTLILMFGALYLGTAGAIMIAVGRAARIGDEAMEEALGEKLKAGKLKAEIPEAELSTLNPHLFQ